MFSFKVFMSSAINFFIFILLLFLPAGTWDWWRAWFFLAVITVASVLTMRYVFAGNRDLLAERLKPPIQHGQPLSDKIIVLLLLVAIVVQIVLAPFDVFRFHWLPRPGHLVSILGLALSLAGWVIVTLALKANTFAVLVVRHQVERQHQVIDRGVYAIVRHPMYSGLLLYQLGYTLWLESYAAALMTLPLAAVLALRILVEERFLKKELPGYTAYTTRVRWRLIPPLW